MTKEELWAAYVAKNPSFAGDGNITMSARGLRKLFDQTWGFGYDAGAITRYSVAEGYEPIPTQTPSKDISDFFGGIFK